MSRRTSLLHIALIVFLGLLVYSNTVKTPFVFDDALNVVMNVNIRSLSNVPALFFGKGAVYSSRPLMQATFTLNYYFGGLDPTGYHAVNLALHLINGVLLYFLVMMTGRLLRYAEDRTRTVAFFASALFVAHPVQTEAVTYIVSRSMLLATTFYLSGIMLYAKAATAERRGKLYITGLFVVSLLGAASRENFVTFPLMLVLYDLFFISKFRSSDILGRWKLYIPVLIACAYLIYLSLNSSYDPRVTHVASIPPLQYVLTQLDVHWTYLRLLALPINQNLDYDYPVAQTLFEFPTILSFAGHLGLLAGAMIFARRRPVVSFSVLWFFIALIPISIGLAFTKLRLGDVIFEHRLYLPSAGVIAAFAAVAVSSARQFKDAWAKRAIAVCLVFALAVFSVAAYKRNSVWQSKVSLWKDVVRKSPNKMRGYVNLASACNQIGLVDEAIRYNLILLTKDFPEISVSQITLAHYNLAYSYSIKGLIDKAIEQYNLVIEFEPPWVGYAHGKLGYVYMQKGLYDKAIEHFNIALKLEPRLVEVYNNLGVAYMRKGYIDKAIGSLKTAIAIDPRYVNAHNNLGRAYMRKGMQEEAQEHFRIADSLGRAAH